MHSNIFTSWKLFRGMGLRYGGVTGEFFFKITNFFKKIENNQFFKKNTKIIKFSRGYVR